MSAIIEVDQLGKRFRLMRERNSSLKSAILRGRRADFEEFWALREVSFEIEEGSTFGIVGSNGSGKSTLLKCLARILRPDEGSVAVGGSLSALLELGAGFHPELSGRENVYLNGSILGLTQRDIRAKFDEIVGFAGLEKFIDEPVKNYSSGMYVRLGFSVAINVDPEILLIDEVLAVGDNEFQRKCMLKFEEFRRAGKTVVLVSHSLDTVRAVCDHGLWLGQGRVRASGRVDDVVDKYAQVAEERRREAARANQAERMQPWRAEPLGGGSIRSIELIDESGEPSAVFESGGPIRIRVRYDATSIGEPVTVAVGMYRLDGAHVTSVNAGKRFHDRSYADGIVTVEYVVPHLPLVPAAYEVSVALHDRRFDGVFERRDRVVRFDVVSDGPAEVYGLVDLAGTWTAATCTP